MAKINSTNNSSGSLTIDPASGDSVATYAIGGTTKFETYVYDTDDSFRISDGTTDYLTITSDGVILKPKQACAGANKSSQTSNVTGDSTTYTIINNNEIWDLNSDYNSGTGIFIAPKTGVYYISSCAYLLSMTTSHEILDFRIVCSNRFVRGSNYSSTSGTGIISSAAQPVVFGLVDMDVGDTAYCSIRVAGSTKTISAYGEAGFVSYITFALMH